MRIKPYIVTSIHYTLTILQLTLHVNICNKAIVYEV